MKQICEKALPWLSVASNLTSITDTVSGAVKAISKMPNKLRRVFDPEVGVSPRAPPAIDEESKSNLSVGIELEIIDREEKYVDSVTPVCSRPPTFRGDDSVVEGEHVFTSGHLSKETPMSGDGVKRVKWSGPTTPRSPPMTFANETFARSPSPILGTTAPYTDNYDDADGETQQL